MWTRLALEIIKRTSLDKEELGKLVSQTSMDVYLPDMLYCVVLSGSEGF